MAETTKKGVIKRFVIAISKPFLSADESLKLIETVLLDLKAFKLESEDYGYMWKGIFYAIWHTEMDKGCNTIATKFCDLADSKLIIHGFEYLSTEWSSIDYIRIDKFMYLVRRLTNRLFFIHLNQYIKFRKTKQSKGQIESTSQSRQPNPLKRALQTMNDVGLIDHFLDIFYTECFKVMSPLLGKEKHNQLVIQFLLLINKTLINRLAFSAKDVRILKIFKIELFNLHNHLKRNKTVLEATMKGLIKNCDECSCKNIRSLGSALRTRFDKFFETRIQHPDIIEQKAKLTYNRKKALKNKSLKLQNKKRKKRAELEAAFKEQQSKITEISPEEQFNEIIGI